MDRYLLSGAFALLLFELTILFSELNWINWDITEKDSSKEVIGRVLSTQDKVRKKRQGSIAWQDSFSSDLLQAYDSILTLDQSSAELKLENDIQLTLHENTLIVIEPSQKNDNKTQLNFSKGQLFSRIKQRSLKLGSEFWGIEAKPGTSLSLKSLPNNQLEIEVDTGEIELVNKLTEKKKSITKDSVVTTSSKKIENLRTVNQQLIWPKEKDRVYSHLFPHEYQIKWSGPATELHVQSPQMKLTTYSVKNQQELTIPLQKGTYNFRLKNKDDNVSKNFIIESLQAPVIQYFSPLPRERIITGESIYFNWTALNNIKDYHLEFSEYIDFREVYASKESEGNRISLNISEEKSLYWRVLAKDNESFHIPAIFTYDLFSTENPFAAPKTIKTKVRSPASDSPTEILPLEKSRKQKPTLINKIINIILPRAHAQDTKYREVKFEWEEVSGADFYILEVSSKPNFIHPELNTRVFSNSYIWKEAFKTDDYYIRVAAGDENGRMGLFSKPQLVDLKLIAIEPEVKHAKVLNDEELKELQSFQTQELSINEIKDNEFIFKGSKFNHSEEEEIEPEQVLQLYLNTSYEWSHHKQKNDFESEKNIIIPFAARIHWQNEKAILDLNIDYQQWDVDEDRYPFQQKLSHVAANFSWLYRRKKQHAFGLFVEGDSLPKRKSFEELELVSKVFTGLSYKYNFQFGKWYSDLNFSLSTSDDLWNIQINEHLYIKKYMDPWQLILGGKIKIKHLTNKDIEVMSLQPSLFIGAEW